MTEEQEIIEKIKKIVNKNYSSEFCGYTEQTSYGNDKKIFNDGFCCGTSWLAYEIGLLLGVDLETPKEEKREW